jgi:DNA-binding transcriptional regulator YdaS (Cro superfamily)
MDTPDAILKAKQLFKTQEEMAKACGVSQNSVFNWLKGNTKPTGKSARLIEIATGGRVTREELRPDIFN